MDDMIIIEEINALLDQTTHKDVVIEHIASGHSDLYAMIDNLRSTQNKGHFFPIKYSEVTGYWKTKEEIASKLREYENGGFEIERDFYCDIDDVLEDEYLENTFEDDGAAFIIR